MPDKISFSLNRQKSLKSKILLNDLFTKGQSIIDYPLRLVYLEIDIDSEQSFLTAFSVPKRKFKKAVDRNRIKRLMRERFRLQQNESSLPRQTIMMWIYMDRQTPSFDLIYNKMHEIMLTLNHQLNVDQKLIKPNGTTQ